jgi:hypothetical protein
MIIKKEQYLMFFISLIAFFPLFPPIFQRNEQHINIIALFLSLFAIFSFKIRIDLYQRVYLFSYFFIFQLALMLSFWLGTEPIGGYSDILSYHRPIMLFIMAFGLVVLIDDLELTYLKLTKIFKVIVTVVFVYSLLEVFAFDVFSAVMFLFYRIEDKSNIGGTAVSFFTLPYYSSYILLIVLPFLISFRKLTKQKSDSKYIFFCFISIILTQSKMGIVLAIGIFFFYAFLSANLKNKLKVSLFFLIMLSIAGYFIIDFISYLKTEFGGNFARTLHLMLTNTEQAHNLNERLKDITETYAEIMLNNPYVGIGLGKGKTIEIWIGSILYRYGFVGLLFFIMFFLFTGLKAIMMISKVHKSSPIQAELLKIIAIWSLTLYISQLSGFMFEMSKAAVFSMLMLALCTRTLFRNNKIATGPTNHE